MLTEHCDSQPVLTQNLRSQTLWQLVIFHVLCTSCWFGQNLVRLELQVEACSSKRTDTNLPCKFSMILLELRNLCTRPVPQTLCHSIRHSTASVTRTTGVKAFLPQSKITNNQPRCTLLSASFSAGESMSFRRLSCSLFTDVGVVVAGDYAHLDTNHLYLIWLGCERSVVCVKFQDGIKPLPTLSPFPPMHD